MAEELGAPIECNLTRTEDDTDDITVRLKDSAGALVDTTNFTGTLSIGTDKDAAPTATFAGAGTGVDGLIVFDMNLFAVPIGSYKYDIRLIDGNPADNPARVYFKGSFKVTPRIN